MHKLKVYRYRYLLFLYVSYDTLYRQIGGFLSVICLMVTLSKSWLHFQVFFASVIINSPYFFVFRIVDDKESGDLRKTYTAWAVSAGFSVFSWVRGTLAQFLPLVALLCLNVLLLLTIRRSKERCRKVSAFSQVREEDKCISHDNIHESNA